MPEARSDWSSPGKGRAIANSTEVFCVSCDSANACDWLGPLEAGSEQSAGFSRAIWAAARWATCPGRAGRSAETRREKTQVPPAPSASARSPRSRTCKPSLPNQGWGNRPLPPFGTSTWLGRRLAVLPGSQLFWLTPGEPSNSAAKWA